MIRRRRRRPSSDSMSKKGKMGEDGKRLRGMLLFFFVLSIFIYGYNWSADGAFTTVHMSFRQKAGDTYWMIRSIASRSLTRGEVEDTLPVDRESHTQCKAQKTHLAMHLKVPKAASTTMFDLIYGLRAQKKNFAIDSRPLYVSKKRPNRSQREYAAYLSSFHVNVIRTAHCPYIDFASLGQPRPAYFGLVREPSARLRSHYDYVHWGPRSRWATFWKGQNTSAPSFDTCLYLSLSHKDTVNIQGSCLFWANAQLAYFCGIHCLPTRITSEPQYAQTAYEKALNNVEKDFVMVGLVERFTDALLVLEAVLPYYFHGATKLAATLKASRINTNQIHHSVSQSNTNLSSAFNVSAYLRHVILPFEYRFYHRLEADFNLQLKACIHPPSTATGATETGKMSIGQQHRPPHSFLRGNS